MGNLVAGLCLDLINFPVNAKPDLLPAQIQDDFGIMYSSVAVILIVTTWIFWGYNLDKKRHDEILRQLRDREDAGIDKQAHRTGEGRLQSAGGESLATVHLLGSVGAAAGRRE